MLIYDMTERGNTPIYEYLYVCIRDDIVGGRLASGDKLPSKREFAADNGVALITVENAYEQLIVEGYVEAVPRKGYYVCEIGVRSETVKSEPAGMDGRYGRRETADPDEPEKLLADFTSGAIQSEMFPYATWSKLMRRVLNDRKQDFIRPPQAQGVEELRNAIAGYLRDSRGLLVDPHRVIVGPGTEYLHSIILQLIGRSRLVAVEDPGYKKAEKIYEGNGLKVMHIPVDGEGMMVEKLYDSNVRLAHVSPAHHFPTGSVMSAARRHRMISWAKESDSYIIEDDFDSEFRFHGRPLPTLTSLDSEHVIYMNTFTGTLAPSIRIAFMVLPEALMNEYERKLTYISGTVSTFEQLTLAAFIDEGYFARHISRLRNKYGKLSKMYKVAFEKSDLCKTAQVQEADAGWQFVIHIDMEADDKEYVSMVKKKGILIRSVADYCYNTAIDYSHRYVLRYIDVPERELIDIFDSLCCPE